MSPLDDLLDPLAPLAAGEEDAARRLAEALDGRGPAEGKVANVGEVGEALATARLLQSLNTPEDDLAGRRLRKDLVSAAGRRAGRRFVRSLAAAAVLVLGAGLATVAIRHRDISPVSRLNQREAEAKAALLRLQATEEGPVGTLTTSLASSRFSEKFDSLRETRLTRLGASSIFTTSTGSLRHSPEPTPGGPS